jgi:hypothetical protein
MRLVPLLLPALLVACSAPPPPAATPTPRPASRPAATTAPRITSIVIADEWGGLGQRTDVHVRLVPEGDGFRREGTVRTYVDEKALDSALVPREAVMALVDAAVAPRASRDALLATLAAREALAAGAEPAHAAIAEGEPCGPAARALFLGRYTDPDAARAALVAYFDSRHTDDYPHAEVEIHYANGQTRVLASDSQSAWLVPWTTPEGESWDPALARALAGVLPPQSPNRTALSAPAAHVVAHAVRDNIDIDLWQGACR